MAKKGSFQSCGTNAKNREQARQAHFACSSSQSESMIRFILPACGFSHIITENNINFLPWYPQDPLRFQLMRLLRNSSPIRRFLLCCQRKEQQQQQKKTNKCMDHQPHHSPLMQETGCTAFQSF